MFDATTILGYKGEGKAVIGGDGQVTFGDTVLKGNATKIRTLHEGKLAEKKGDLFKSVIGFSKMWRKDKHLRQLEAMMIVLNREHIFILSGTGDVVEPQDGKIAAIGSGGNYAISAARALDKHTTLDPKELVQESLEVAGDLCIYTNKNIKILEL